jgi:hypothetical protein
MVYDMDSIRLDNGLVTLSLINKAMANSSILRSSENLDVHGGKKMTKRLDVGKVGQESWLGSQLLYSPGGVRTTLCVALKGWQRCRRAEDNARPTQCGPNFYDTPILSTKIRIESGMHWTPISSLFPRLRGWGMVLNKFDVEWWKTGSDRSLPKLGNDCQRP